MPRATTLEQARKVLDPRPLVFVDRHPEEASDPRFYAELPEPLGWRFRLPGPIARIRRRILDGARETKLFLSGHVGSGKSTELNRLMADPEIRERFVVVPLRFEEQEWATLDSTQTLFRIATRLFERFKDRLAGPARWKRVLRTLNDRIFEPMGIRVTEGSTEVEINALLFKLRQDLKLSSKVRQQFREFGETNQSVLQDFLEALVDDVEASFGDGPSELLVVVDDLDKLRSEEQQRDVFGTNLSALLAPPLRVLYTVPTAVRFGYARAEIWQNAEDLYPVRVLDKAPGSFAPEDAYTDERIGFFQVLVDRRVEPALIDREAVRLAAIYSGGVLRDFFRLLREGALLASYNDLAVLDAVAMRYAVEEERRKESVGLYAPDYDALLHVHRTNALRAADDRRYLALSRVIECFDGTVWFDVSPVLWPVLEEHLKRTDDERRRR